MKYRAVFTVNEIFTESINYNEIDMIVFRFRKLQWM